MKKYILTLSGIVIFIFAIGQNNANSYPDSLANGKELIFEITVDSLIQTVYLQALGEGKLFFNIVTRVNNKFSAKIQGTASIDMISKGENNQWGYVSQDNSYYILIHNPSASEVEITRPLLTSKPMKRIISNNQFQR
jgi:hypothetical protein